MIASSYIHAEKAEEKETSAEGAYSVVIFFSIILCNLSV